MGDRRKGVRDSGGSARGQRIVVLLWVVAVEGGYSVACCGR